jgi:lysophospholipase L1-like esterase
MTRRLKIAAALACALATPFLLAQATMPQPASVVPAVPPQTVPLQAVPATPPLAQQLPVPAPQPTVPDLTRYLNNPDLLKFCTAQVAAFNDRDADIIFIGDSITQGWRTRGEAVWQANFAPRKALDFGIGGDQTQHVLWRMDNYPIQRLHPKVAVVLIGTNNNKNTAPEIADGVKAVLTKTQTMYPGIKIILVSIMPRSKFNDLMMAADAILKTYADDKTVFYLDLVPVMTPVGDNYLGLGPDHLHPDASGYQLWADAMLPLLNKLLPPVVVGVPVQP